MCLGLVMGSYLTDISSGVFVFALLFDLYLRKSTSAKPWSRVSDDI